MTNQNGSEARTGKGRNMEKEKEIGRAEAIGSLLVMPMLSEGDLGALLDASEPWSVDTPDLSIGVREMFGADGTLLTACRRVRAAEFNRLLFGPRADSTILVNGAPENTLDLGDLIVYVFRTGVAFACAALTCARIELLADISHPGYAEGDARYRFAGEPEDFPLETRIEDVLESLGLRSFYGRGSLFLEAFVYISALVPARFPTLEEIRDRTFRLHKMAAMDQPVADLSEEDVSYVYAAMDQTLGSYRWGCCISTTTISYVSADPEMDFAAELESQIRDGLPLAVLALYEKYTCLHFGRVLSRNMSAKNNRRQVRELKRRMLEFKAYGTVGEAMISRWHNVRMIYAHLLDCFGVERSIQELSDKLEILSDAQKETEEARTNALMTGITIFGIISILDSLLSIYEVIVNGNTAEWLMLRVSVAVIALLFMGFLLLVRGRRK